MQQIYSLFESFGNSSKVWLYFADRRLTNEEVSICSADLNSFNNTWSAHGKKLHSGQTILFNHVIVLVVDENTEAASGCSIDSSVHAIKKIGAKINVDFFNRLNVLTWNNGEVDIVPYSVIRKNKGLFYLNPLVSTLGELRENWIIQS